MIFINNKAVSDALIMYTCRLVQYYATCATSLTDWIFAMVQCSSNASVVAACLQQAHTNIKTCLLQGFVQYKAAAARSLTDCCASACVGLSVQGQDAPSKYLALAVKTDAICKALVYSHCFPITSLARSG